MPQQTSTFESHFLTHMQDVAGANHKLIACSWVPILQVGGLGKVRVNCFPKAITTWLGRESNPRPPDPESDALTTLDSATYDNNNQDLRRTAEYVTQEDGRRYIKQICTYDARVYQTIDLMVKSASCRCS